MKHKEIKLSPNIATNDIEYRVKQAIKFLEEGDRVKLTLSFRGREILFTNKGREVLINFMDRCHEAGRQDSLIRLDGKRMTVILRPLGRNDKR